MANLILFSCCFFPLGIILSVNTSKGVCNKLASTHSMLGKIISFKVLIYHIFYFYLFFFLQKVDFDISCKLSPQETICMQYQSLLSVKSKLNIIDLLSAESAHRVIKVNLIMLLYDEDVKITGILPCFLFA